MASLKAEGIDTLVPVLVWVARVASPAPPPLHGRRPMLEPPAS